MSEVRASDLLTFGVSGVVAAQGEEEEQAEGQPPLLARHHPSLTTINGLP